MDFETFKSEVQILNKKEGEVFRKRYIDKFIDTKSIFYQENIKKTFEFSDGHCYLGYLWDCVKDIVVIDMDYIEKKAKSLEKVFVFWDIHSCERIFIKNYWKFDKDVVLKLNFRTLINGFDFLPEDIYIFDENISWTLVKTHEEIDGKCYCIKSGNI